MILYICTLNWAICEEKRESVANPASALTYQQSIDLSVQYLLNDDKVWGHFLQGVFVFWGIQ